MIYDYAPRLAARARARRRRNLLFTLCLLSLPALSLQSVRGSTAPIAEPSLQLAQTQR